MKGRGKEQEPLVLLVEDNTADILLLREALRAEAPPCQIQVLTTGEQAWQFFRREEPYTEARRPDLVVLDFSLPGRDGGEIVALIRRTAELDQVPVLMVSSAPSSYIRERAPEADAHWTKPTDLEEFLALGQKIRQFLPRSR